MHGGTKFHEDKIARRVKFARRCFCTKTNLHEGTKLNKDKFARLSNLHGGSNLHEDTFARGDIFARKFFFLTLIFNPNPCKFVFVQKHLRANLTLRAILSLCNFVFVQFCLCTILTRPPPYSLKNFKVITVLIFS